MENFTTSAIQYINNKIYNAKKISLKDTILIAGSPRSGTTWLMEIFATLPKYTYLFEPLNPIWNPKSFDVGFRSRTYLPADTYWPEGIDFLKKTFTGKISNLPIKDNIINSLKPGITFNKIIHFLYGNKLIVKSVNMNRILPWIAKNFELRSIFLIIRHPCASIASQLKTGLCGYRSSTQPYFDIFPTKEIILDEALKIDEFDSNLINKLKKIEKIEEILAVTWCIDNFIPLSKPYTWNIVFYEKLVNKINEEIQNIFNSIGEKDIPRSAYKIFRKPSLVTMKDDEKYIKKPNKQLSKCKENFSQKQINNILKILSYFNMDFYSENIEPDYDKL